MVKTKAMVLREFGKPLTLEEVEIPSYGPDEVLLKVKAAGVCGTDLKIRDGLVPTKELPLIPGHEVAGVVAATGANVKRFRVGDAVLVSFYIPCNRCRTCRLGRQTICEQLKGRIGFEFNGGFAEYVAVPEACLIPKPPGLSFRQAAVIPDALGTCYHVLVRRAQVQKGDCLVIVGGGGGLGLHALQMAKVLGAVVIGVDVSAEKLALMKSYGADFVIDGRENPSWSDAVAAYTQGGRADLVVNFVAHQSSIDEGLKAVGKGGKLALVAYSKEVKFNALYGHLNEIDLLSTRAATKEDIEECLKLVLAKEVETVIGEVISLPELNYGLQLIKDGKLKGRLVIDLE
ncbi:alcohol dehydrogenase catalytic domain-containing protein [Capillibacterium thermochitinicola]|uniref:Alcohol dehydrogenase n=1 Tax=Capillibacterium thermochitinicola TaxID=2699427 RepID=A0A8J6I2F8_9FIRM|nr:alcohol dehydrogenase catalytic domain-containing protein [Capillibacterium thermochitinicola]